ncbi:MAG: hypothetical protein ACR2KU_04675 [Gammaproteobacteria bacterium]
MRELWPWLTLFGLGAFHGVNPGMGWLFAVALGLQERKRRAVLMAIPPIALGHALSIGVVVGLLWLAQANLPETALRYGAAAMLFGLGIYRLIRTRNPRWVGMRVNFRDLTLWSFLMASAHGAGLMLAPILLGWSYMGYAGHGTHAAHMQHLSGEQIGAFTGPLPWLMAVVVHTLGYLLVATLVALVVYEKLGVAILRRAWFNLDLLWVIALMISGGVILIS